MPTKREQQILDLIRQNPMITQKELAKILGITRPGVASHISRLIKEGLISGKGYVLPKREYVTVIGAVNMDVYGVIKEQAVVPKSSNSGLVKFQLGGIGRNIAADLVGLGVNTNLITVFGNDVNGSLIKADSTHRGINLAYAKQLTNEATSNYLYINKRNGERIIGVDDMGINRYITPDFLKSRLPGINASNLVVFDTNIPSQTIQWLYDNVRVPMVAKTVSVNKAPNLKQDNVKLDGLVINGIEGSLIAKEQINDSKDARECAKKLARMFNTIVYLYVDDLGLFVCDGVTCEFSPYARNIEVLNTNGVGAAMTAMVAYTKLRKIKLKQAVNLITRVGELTMQTSQSVSDQLSDILE